MKGKTNKYDKTNFFNLIELFPEQLVEADAIAQKKTFKLDRPVSNVVICGMGGSGIGGKLVQNLTKSTATVPITTHGDYSLPGFVNEHSLVCCVSYSGNTEEILSAYKEAKKRNCQVLSITSGGKLLEWDKTAIQVPAGYPPRAALAFLFVPLLHALSQSKLVPDYSISLKQSIVSLHKNQSKLQKTAQKIVKQIGKKMPIIYGTALFSDAAYRFTTEFNENAKVLAHYHVIPEHNHNEISAIPNTKNAFYILLREQNEPAQIQKRFEFVKKLIKTKNFHEEKFNGESALENLLTAIHLAAWTTYYLAIQHKQDPNAIPLITQLRKELAK
ncbi:MAG: bifunctional phosphoglucose/phosphomannose isomerase [Candidatus Diapherotrites archaeon]|uniref:Bifunctional phosphoglucose/phosphomannose isomerase n=1 Tax=Candidatus Iainarchaeum sp. TaxID=3101447 RepID=A0A8T4L580_9ARCH|nr:bifunctional phosphoglucose/phosphomannose isomerase [Candidatus Diapherotrites archaeon]